MSSLDTLPLSLYQFTRSFNNCTSILALQHAFATLDIRRSVKRQSQYYFVGPAFLTFNLRSNFFMASMPVGITTDFSETLATGATTPPNSRPPSLSAANRKTTILSLVELLLQQEERGVYISFPVFNNRK